MVQIIKLLVSLGSDDARARLRAIRALRTVSTPPDRVNFVSMGGVQLLRPWLDDALPCNRRRNGDSLQVKVAEAVIALLRELPVTATQLHRAGMGPTFKSLLAECAPIRGAIHGLRDHLRTVRPMVADADVPLATVTDVSLPAIESTAGAIPNPHSDSELANDIAEAPAAPEVTPMVHGDAEEPWTLDVVGAAAENALTAPEPEAPVALEDAPKVDDDTDKHGALHVAIAAVENALAAAEAPVDFGSLGVGDVSGQRKALRVAIAEAETALSAAEAELEKRATTESAPGLALAQVDGGRPAPDTIPASWTATALAAPVKESVDLTVEEVGNVAVAGLAGISPEDCTPDVAATLQALFELGRCLNRVRGVT